MALSLSSAGAQEQAKPQLAEDEIICPTCQGCGKIKDPAQGASQGEWISIFDGKTFQGWRGYNRKDVPGKWCIEDGAIKFNGTGTGEAQSKDGGDLLYDEKLGNFELEFEWKISKGGNSGVMYLCQEIKGQPAYISAPEYQILDNAHHPDARLGVKGNRQSASLYDFVPAVPQNQKPYGEWNKGKILVYKGTVIHYQNNAPVVEYHLWTDQWREMLDKSKFSKDKWPIAYEKLLNCGGDKREGYVVFQDHGDDVWYRNIKVRKLE